MVIGIPDANDEACSVSSVDEADRAVMAQQEVVGHFADCGAPGIGMPADREQQLVLCGRQARRPRLALAPALELPEPGAQGEQASIDVVRQSQSCHDNIVLR